MSLQISLLCIVGELAGVESVTVAVGVSDRRQVTNTSTDIATYRLNRPMGGFSEKNISIKCIISSISSQTVHCQQHISSLPYEVSSRVSRQRSSRPCTAANAPPALGVFYTPNFG